MYVLKVIQERSLSIIDCEIIIFTKMLLFFIHAEINYFVNELNLR